MLVVFLAAFIVLYSPSAFSRELYPGQYANADPWFKEQKVPNSNAPCCNAADGATAEEEIRGEHYWVRFTYKKWDSSISAYVDAPSGWMQVPEAALLPTNHNGAPIVWWYMDSSLKIRCYARGSGI